MSELEIQIENAVFRALEKFHSLPVKLSKSEAARQLKISRNTLNKRIGMGIIKTLPDGRIDRFEILRLQQITK